MSFIYTYFIYPLVLIAFWLISWTNPKVRKGFQLRKKKPWLRPFASGSEWVWFHVASGELEYAKPVIRELKKKWASNPQMKILVTYFSPSVLSALEKTQDIDLFVPMPWDTPKNWDDFLEHFNPQVLAIARTDTWPNMIWQTRKKGIPAILFSATLPQKSGRYASFLGRLFYGKVVENLSLISCVTEEDAQNFRTLSPKVKVTVEGDTRFDQVISRVEENRPIATALEKSEILFVAGSTWPEDEKILLPAMARLVTQGLKAIIAPHEPTPAHLRALEESCASLQIRTRRYSTLDDSPLTASLVIVDRVGILADLYRLGQVAFVGGSFKKSVHSVMEPASSGCFCLVGPHHHNSREALALKSHGFLREVETSQTLEDILLREMKKQTHETQGRRQAILNFVNSNKGVSQRIANWITDQVQNP